MQVQIQMLRNFSSLQRKPHGNFTFILFLNQIRLDGKHVVFGQVIGGLDIVKKMESLGSASGQTRGKVTILHSDTLV